MRADFAGFAVPAAALGAAGASAAPGTDPYRLLIDHGRCVATVLGGTIVHRKV